MSWFLTSFVFITIAVYGAVAALTPVQFNFGMAVAFITMGFLTDVCIHFLQTCGCGFR